MAGEAEAPGVGLLTSERRRRAFHQLAARPRAKVLPDRHPCNSRHKDDRIHALHRDCKRRRLRAEPRPVAPQSPHGNM
eukprot:1716378-Prymnesium_polylepis.1